MAVKIDISVIVLSYNHEKFIQKCLESILCQNIQANVEIIIYDDASTDSTPQLIENSLEKFEVSNFRIRSIRSNENQFQFGQGFMNSLYSMCMGTYICILEGDDYWVSDKKLQKQYDFLNLNEDYSICATAFISGPNENDATRHPLNAQEKFIDVPLERFSIGNEIGLLTVMFRNLLPTLPEEFNLLPIGDYPVWGILSQFGKIGILNEVMAFYRKHDNNYFSGKTPEFQFLATIEARRFIATHTSGTNQAQWIRALSDSLKDIYLDNSNLRADNLKYVSENESLKYNAHIAQIIHDKVQAERDELISLLLSRNFRNHLGIRLNLKMIFNSTKSILISILKKLNAYRIR